MTLIPRWLRNNLQIKVALFLLATLLWFLVVTRRSYEDSLTIPIAVTGLAAEKMLSEPIPLFAQVKFQATGRELMQMRWISHPTLTIDVSAMRGAKRSYAVHPGLVVMPGGSLAVPIDVLHPDTVTIVVDNKSEATLPVTPQIHYDAVDGYTVLGEPMVTPSHVKITGPEKVVDRLTELSTEDHELSQVKYNTEVNLIVKVPGKYGVTVDPSTVKALIRVERLGEKNLVSIPIKLLNVPIDRKCTIEPSTVDVKVIGAVSVISTITAKDITASADYGDYIRTQNPRLKLDISTKLSIVSAQGAHTEAKLILQEQ